MAEFLIKNGKKTLVHETQRHPEGNRARYASGEAVNAPRVAVVVPAAPPEVVAPAPAKKTK